MENENEARHGLSGVIRELRAELKISKAELGRMLGVSPPTVEKWEADPTQEQIDMMIGICHRNGLHRIAQKLAKSAPADDAAMTGDCLAYLRFKAYEPQTPQGKRLKDLILDTIAAFANGGPAKDFVLF